mgnify:CR=1 FL=1
MNFELTEEQQAVKEAARDFAQNVLKPGVIDRDRDQKFPVEEMKQLLDKLDLKDFLDPPSLTNLIPGSKWFFLYFQLGLNKGDKDRSILFV